MKFKVVLDSFRRKTNKLIAKVKNIDNKKSILIGGIGVLTLLIFIVGATYAYFSAQSNSGSRTDVDVITGTTDLISFSFGSEINIQATEENFAQGMGDLSDSTTAQALLRANNTTNSVTTRYNIYLVIESNDFEYTTKEGTPEILLNVTDPNGNKVENITGLVHYEDGFDITTRTGGFLLVPDYVISAGSTQTVQDWNIEVTFVNLDSDQQANTNKTLTGKIYMTQDIMNSYELTQINNFETSTTYNSITITPEITAGSAAVEKYYYGIEESTNAIAYSSNSLTRLSNTLAAVEDVEFIESEEPSHTFSNLEPNNTYTVYSYTVDENNIKSNVYSTDITTDELNLPTVDSVSHNVTLNSIAVNVTASNGSNNISKYMYKINDEEWIESYSNSYTFNNLLDSTEYEIRIKVVDSEGIESTEYYEAITTEIYILPIVTTVNAETTWNSITLTPTGTDGTNTIAHYEYSIDNGIYQESNTFNNLTDNHEYTINVKAIDTIGRESNVYTLQVTTDEYKLPTIDNVETSSTAEAITVSIDATGIDGDIVSYHYSRDDGSNYVTSTSSVYTFTNLSLNTTYYIKVFVTDSNGKVSGEYSLVEKTVSSDVILTTNNTDNIYNPSAPAILSCNGATTNYNQKYQRIEISAINNRFTNCTLTYSTPNSKTYLNNYIISLAGTTQGNGQIVNENGYRYEGKNPNNYIWFNNELWRIIGVFDDSSHGKNGYNLVKIIRNNSIGALSWDSANKNDWSNASLMKLLNGAYYNWNEHSEEISNYCYGNYAFLGSISNCDYTIIGINDTYRPMVENVTWYLGGHTDTTSTVDTYYNAERESTVYSGNQISTTGYIGLMYVSDYGYGALANVCPRTTGLFSNEAATCAGQNWFYGQGEEWTITQHSSDNFSAFYFNSTGYLFVDGTVIFSFGTNNGRIVRPTLYLNSNVYIVDGDGSLSNPYIIGM